MPATSHITLEMALTEMKRIGGVMKKHYPQMVADKKISPYTRDHRLAVNEKIIELLQDAYDNRKKTEHTFVSLINQLK